MSSPSASTTDGINFSDVGPVSELQDPITTVFNGIRWLGSGSIIALANGRYGKFFAAGDCLDNDCDGFNAGTGGALGAARWPQHEFFSGRVYDPQAIVTDRSRVTIVFAGYNTPQPSSNLGDYRTIGRFQLRFPDDYVARPLISTPTDVPNDDTRGRSLDSPAFALRREIDAPSAPASRKFD